jgi:predicted ATP-dependent protease
MFVSDLLMVLTLTAGPNLNDRERAIMVRKRKIPKQFIWTIARNVQMVRDEHEVINLRCENMRYDLQFDLQVEESKVVEFEGYYGRSGLLLTILCYRSVLGGIII